MEIRTPIIAILVLIILIVIYLRKSMPQVFSTRVFFAFLVGACINLVCEIAECAVFLYLDESYHVLRTVSQILYVASLLACAFMISEYVYAKLIQGRAPSKGVIACITLPGAIGIISLFVVRITYDTNRSGEYYSSGTAVLFCYFVGFSYIFVTLLIAIVKRRKLRLEEARSIISGLLIWAFLALFQFTYHGYQVSSIAIMLMALILFLSSENPREYYEKNVLNVRNREAFNMLLVERCGRKSSFFITSVIFTGKSAVSSGEDRKQLNRLQARFASMGQNIIGEPPYLSYWNTISFITEEPAKVEALMGLVNSFTDERGNYKQTFSVLEIPKTVDKVDKALLVLDYVSSEYVYAHSVPNMVIDDNIVDKMTYRNSIEDIVRQALKDKAFDVYYQPILNANDGTFASAEALVRLRRPNTENFISPEDFIPIAENCGIIQDIDDLVFEKVCSFIARENLTSYGIKTIEVNLSGNEVVDRQTYVRLVNKMEKYHIPPKLINFEITETAYINNDEAFKDNVRKLKQMGSTFSMDDFGSGYSNLLELLKMDYVLVKMDKEFIWKCLDKDKPENMRMLEYSINFLKDYGLHVLAEGVETVEQAEFLIEKGVEYLQGFYYSRPIPEDEYIEFLKAQKGDGR